MKRIRILLVSAAVLAFAASEGSIAAARASDPPIYRYIDRHGGTAFTNDLSRIPAEYRGSATIVELPPAVTVPAPTPPPQPAPSSFSVRLREWFQARPAGYRLIIVGVLPPLIVSLWAMNFFRKRSDSLFVKMSLRLGMLGILVLSAYLCYFIFAQGEAGRLIGTVPGAQDLTAFPKQRAEELKKDEADRLKTIEDIGNQRNEDDP